MICPKCFTVEKEDGLRCHKCGAQLQTGVFRQPLPMTREAAPPQNAGGRFSGRTSLVVVAVLAAAALALLLVLSALDVPA
jgi:hypothetical protein